MSTPPPGWYPDENGQQHWWDGRQWQATPPQPQYQRPGVAPDFVVPGSDVRLGRPWVIPVIVVVALLAIAGAYVGSLAFADRTSAGDARDVAVRLTEAVVDGDCRGVQEATSQDYYDSVGWTCAQIADDGEWMRANDVTFEVGTAVVEGDTGRVPVEVSMPGESTDGTFLVRNVSGHWIVTGEEGPATEEAPAG